MLSSKRERFHWSKQDRMAELSFFRLLHQNWHPTTRSVTIEERPEMSGRYSSRQSATGGYQQSGKSVWTPWLWVGS